MGACNRDSDDVDDDSDEDGFLRRGNELLLRSSFTFSFMLNIVFFFLSFFF